MKIIDNKGRLFGKLNLIDLLVILLVLALAAAVVLKVTGNGGDREARVEFSDADPNALEYTVLCRMVAKTMVPAAMEEVGNTLMASGKLVEGCRVLSVEELPHMEQVVLDDGTVQQVENQEYCDLSFVIGGSAPYEDYAYHVGTQEVRVGKSHIVKTLTLEMTGTVTAMTGGAFAAEVPNG